jgi:hypothetical protein
MTNYKNEIEKTIISYLILETTSFRICRFHALDFCYACELHHTEGCFDNQIKNYILSSLEEKEDPYFSGKSFIRVYYDHVVFRFPIRINFEYYDFEYDISFEQLRRLKNLRKL